ncbi:MAG: hypothetical protein MUP45_01010 [Candidatus Marinimicrobia bacterium]|nr:hypothetical protein [Candidatus Neomarinimicrobiota bacterium]
MTKKNNQKKSFQIVGTILKGFDWDEKKYISREFQDFGYRLAEALNDLEHKSLYIKLAKETPRVLLEEARNFVKDANQVNNPARLFMWKLAELKKKKKK